MVKGLNGWKTKNQKVKGLGLIELLLELTAEWPFSVLHCSLIQVQIQTIRHLDDFSVAVREHCIIEETSFLVSVKDPTAPIKTKSRDNFTGGLAYIYSSVISTKSDYLNIKTIFHCI